MIMSTCGKAMDGPAVLQLQTWGPLQSQIKLSDFCEASISPTRKLLLLLSCHCEALLIPLLSGNASSHMLMNGDDSGKFCSEKGRTTTCVPLCSQDKAAMVRTNLLDDVPCLASNCYPIISDVKSLAWGHFGDAYNQNENSGFRELLIVSSDNGIIAHAFRYMDKSTQIIERTPEDGSVHGKWVEWGPSHNIHLEEQVFSDFGSSESLHHISGVDGTERKISTDGDSGHVSPSSTSFTHKNWFRTFLTELDSSLYDCKYMVKFPQKSSLPHSAEVVSFSIYDSTLKFLGVHSHSNYVSDRQENCSSETVGSLDSEVVISESRPEISSLEERFSCQEGPASIPYKCSRVFSSMSYRYIGLVLTLPEDTATKTCGESWRHASEILVVVIMLHEWGIEWLCSVDLQDLYPGPVPGPEWADFQFLDDFLVSLSTSGLIFFWGAKSGKLVAHLNVLHSCGLNSEVHSELDRSKQVASGDPQSKMTNVEEEIDQSTKVGGSGTYARDIACMGTFKQLMVVSSHSFLLACIDEYGVIYVVCPDDYISKDHYLQHSDVDMFSSWKVAGCEIGRQKEFSEVFIGKGLNFMDIPYRGSSKVNQDKKPILKKSRTQYYDCENIQLEINSSGFATASQEKGRKLPHLRCNTSSSPIRRIFLPLSRYKKGDSICFSPFGITRLIRSCNSDEQKTYVIVHTCLHIASSDERDPFTCLPFSQESAFFGESIGCSFQGCLYLVTQAGISVILPSISVSSSVCQLESIKYWQPNTFTRSNYQMKNLLEINVSQEYRRPWQIEVLDRALLYEGPDKAELICLENGWDLKIARVRRLQLALHYLKYDEIEKSLDMLVHVNMAEEGILRLLFTTVYEIFCKVGSENEVALASRLLVLAACFATKMVRIYGLVERKKDKLIFSVKKDIRISYVQPILPRHSSVNVSNSMRLSEMAHFLEVIRNLQSRISAKNKKIVQGVMLDGRDSANMVDTNVRHDDSPLPIVAMSTVSLVPLDALELQHIGELKFPGPESISNDIHKRALQPIESSVDALCVHGDFTDDTDAAYQRALFPLEKSRDMILRWGMDNLDLKTVVKDALHSGRLPLAVLQLHMQHQRALDSEKESHDTFCEIQDVGRAIAYDLFLKGESGLAVEILRRLGEDIEFILRQLLLGTVRRSLRAQIAQEMKKYGYLRPQEWKTLERIYLVERLYPNSNFWETFLGRQKKVIEACPCLTLPEVNNLKIILHTCDNLIVECGEIDGVVIGSWANVDGGSSPYPFVCEDNDGAGYWSCAALWSDAWDHRTIDRIVLDQPFHLGVHVPWESQFEYYVSHNELMEVCKLLDVIPTSLLSWRTLKVNLNDSSSTENVRSNVNSSDHALYLYDAEELEPVCMNVPHIKIFRSSSVYLCSSWLKMHMEEELAKKNIFLQEYWGSTAEIVPLLARAGLVTNLSEFPIKATLSSSSTELNLPNVIEADNEETAQALHRLVVYYCTQYNFPSFLDLYLDHHNLALTEDSISSLLEAAGDCHWARWLLLSRIKGHEYESSLSNARSNLSRQMILGCNLSVLDIDDIVHTVDDMAEGAGEMAALATLMYAAVPMQKCISTGSVNRNCSSSSQCTLENLRPGLQRFPTLWRTLVAACFGQDLNGCLVSSNAINVYGKSPFLDYMKWRDSLFFSAGGDTSLVQMLPCWFSKHIRRLIKLFVQGPFGWETLSTVSPDGESFLHKESSYIFNINRHAGFNAVSWEASIQKSIEKELYSSLEENGFGVEHHLRRGRALAAFNHILGLRAQNLKSISANQELPGQANAHSDIQMLLSPLTPDEGSLLSSVIPLAIMHFEDSILVASCAFLLELCGLSANILRVDVAVLLRISSHYDSIEDNAAYELVSPKGSFHAVYHAVDLTASLARALADAYIHHDYLKVVEQDFPTKVPAGRQPQCSLMTVLQHLEKASLPVTEEGRTCGFWLSSGVGDGSEFRSQQKDASQQWNLVTKFCQMHNLPLSTKYLALLANDNDWVGFLKEAQLGGFSIDVIIQVAAKEFSDPRLKIHILTVLKNMQSTKKKNSSSTNTLSVERNDELPFSNECNTIVPMELFALLAECEKQKNPGEALLTKAKDLHWPLLAIIASCFPDVSPLSCLTVWLEITASRETSAIKVNDIYTKIANSVGAAIEATNTLPPGSRTVTVRYNRKNPKRRRLLEPSVEYSPVGSSCNFINVVSPATLSISQEIAKEDEGKSMVTEQAILSGDAEKGLALLSNMVAVLCEQHLFLPLLRSFEMFMPSCSLLPFIRSLQAFCQMRLSEASAHLASFSARIKEEHFLVQINMGKDGHVKTAWISSTSVKAAEAMLSTCPSAYEKRCLLQLLAAADFGDGGSAATYFRRLYWKINLAEPSLRRDDNLYLGNETLDDASLLAALEKHGHWEQARNWARQLESGGVSWKFAVHHVTEMQAEAMVAEWKEFLWDIPEERAALWSHCQTLFLRHSFPALQAGSFFLKHAEEIDKEISARELHEMLLLSLQWLSGTITQSNPVYPLHLLREIETRVWLLAVESEAQTKAEGDFTTPVQNLVGGNSTSVIEQTANIITKMDNHINQVHARATERNGTRENNLTQYRHLQILDFNSLVTATSSSRTKRRAKIHTPLRRPAIDSVDSSNDSDDSNSPNNFKSSGELSRNPQLQEENAKVEVSVSGWEEKVKPADLERAVLSLLEFGQIVAAKQLQQKLSPTHVPSELVIVDAALKLAALSSSYSSGEISESVLDPEVLSIIQSSNIPRKNHMIDTLQALESLATKCGQGCGRGICRRIIAVVKAAKVLGLHFSEAFEKRPIELLQLLSLKAQDSLEEAKLLVQTHVMLPSSIARILAESFLKGLLAAHRGGYIDSQKEEGPAPLLWRFSDFLKWAELCPSESEIGHALMRLVMTGQDIPHACEVELLILSHHFYQSSACLDGVDVLVTLAANRVESYVLEGDFSCLARLVTGVSNFHALNFILNILIENGQLELLLQKYSTAETAAGTAEAVRGFRMAVLTSLKLFNPHDLDAFAMVYNHFDMKHETASLLESRSVRDIQQWHHCRDRDRQHEDLLEAMRHLIEAAEVHSTIDAGHKTHRACARASLLSLQIRIPDLQWLDLSETNARRALVEQSRFQEALIVAEAYNLNQPSEWALVLWNQMLKPDLVEQFVAEFVAVLPLQPSMLLELARFYRAEVAARGDQSHFSVWLSPGGLPAEWVKHLGRSFRSLLKGTRDLRVRVQLATIATGFADVIDACMKVLDKVPDNAGPLILRKGHGGAYLPLM